MDRPLEPSRLRARLLPIALLLAPLPFLAQPAAEAQSPDAWILDSYEVVYTEDIHEELETRRQLLPGGTEPVFTWGGRRVYDAYPFGTLAATGTLSVELPDTIVPGEPFTVGGGATGVVSTPGREGLHAAILAAFSECYLPKVCSGALKNQYVDDIAGKTIDLSAPLATIPATLPIDPVDWPPLYTVLFRGGIGTSTPGDPYWRIRVYATYRRPDVAPTPVPAYRIDLDADTTRLPPSGMRPSEATVTATMLDGLGRAVPGEVLRFALDPPDMGRLTTASGITDAAGEVRIRYQAPDAAVLAGRDTVDVVATNATRGIERRLAMRIERYQLALRVDPAEVPVEPVWRAIKVTVDVRDFDGRPVAGDIVQLRVDPPDMGTFIGATLSGDKGPTDAAGRLEAFFEPLPPSQLGGRDRATIYAANLTHGGEQGAGIRFLGLNVIRTWPREGARDIEITPDDVIDLEFDRPLDPATVNGRTVKVATLWHGDLGASAQAAASTIQIRATEDPIPDVGLVVTVRVEGGEDGVRGRDGSVMLGPYEQRFHTMPRFEPRIIVSQVVDDPRDPLYGVISLALKPFVLRVDAGISADSELDHEDVAVRFLVPRRNQDETLDHRFYPGRWPPTVPDAAVRAGNTANVVIRPPFGRGGYAFKAELRPAHAVPQKVIDVPEVTANVNSWADPAAARKIGVLAIPIVNDRIPGFEWRVSRGQQESWLLGLAEPAANLLPLSRLDLRLAYLDDTTCIDPEKCHWATAPWTEWLYWAQHVGRAGFMTRLFGWRYVVVLVPPGWFDRFADHPDVAANPRMYHDAVQSGIWAMKAGPEAGSTTSGFPIAIMEVGTSPEALVHVLGDIEGIEDVAADRERLSGFDYLNDRAIYADEDHWTGAYRSVMNLSVGSGTTWPSTAQYEHFLSLWSQRSCLGAPPCPPRMSSSGFDDVDAPWRVDPAAPSAQQPDPSPVPVMVVSGSIRRAAGGQETGRIDPLVAADDVPTLGPDGPGEYAIELRAAAGAVLARYPLAPAFGPLGSEELAGFLATVPADPAAAAVVVTHGAAEVARRSRSASPPSVRFERPEADVTHRGALDVAWRGDDADGDALAYTLLASGDAGATWAPLVVDTAATTYRLDSEHLPSGQSARLRVVASDGFDSATATIAFGLDNPPTLLAVYPADGARGVPERSTMQARLRDPLDPASVDDDALALVDAAGARVAGDVGYDAPASMVVFTPTLALDPSMSYTVRLAGSVRTLYGRMLDADFVWRFRTRGPTLYLPVAYRGSGGAYRTATPTAPWTPGPLPSPAASRTQTPSAAGTVTPSPSASQVASATATPTPDQAATHAAATLTALAPTPTMTATPLRTPDLVATAVAATLTALAPSPGATSAATPSPSATSGTGPGNAAVDDATTTGANPDLARMAFARGDAITLWLRVVNAGGSELEGRFDYAVLDELDAVVAELSWTGTVAIPPGANWFKLERTVPAAAAPGPHTFRGRVTYAGATTEATSELFLAATTLHAEDFGDPTSGWQGGQDANGSYGYSDGEWRFTHTAADAWRWAAPPAFPHVSDVVVEADARISSATAGAVALVLGLDASGTDFHLFEAFSDGRYAVFRRQAGAWQTLLSPAPSAALATGGASNHLMAARQSGLTYLYANGELLGMVTDLDVPAGRVGIYASNVLPGFEAWFDNVRAYGLR